MRDTSNTDRTSNAACYPELPAGYEAQPAWGVSSGDRSFELIRVYGPQRRVRGSIVAGRLDEARSYWVATWPVRQRSGGEQPAARWITFGEARKRPGPRLSFARFSSVAHLREEAFEAAPGRAP